MGLASVFFVNANADSTYEEKLTEIQKHVSLSFAVNLPFLNKVEAVKSLYPLITDSRYSKYFDRAGTVQAIEIIAVDPYLSPADREPRCLMREHLVLYVADGSEIQALIDNLPAFQSELDVMAETIQRIRNMAPLFEVERRTPSNLSYVATNRDFLRTLSWVEKGLGQTRFKGLIQNFGKIVLKDNGYWALPTSVERSDYIVYDNGHIIKKEALSIRVGHTGLYRNSSIVTQAQIEQLLDIALTYGFKGLDFTLLSEEAVQTTLTELMQFLTPERIAVLKQDGIHSFRFTERFDREDELKNNGTLTLGLKKEQMIQIFDAIYGK